MSWPPPGSKPPAAPRPAPAARPRLERSSSPASPGETTGETKVKPQAKAPEVKPPQFGHDGIDPLRAALILGLPLLAVAVTLLVLFASPLVWLIAAGVAAAGVVGGVVLRRSKRARGLLRRLPGAGGARPGLRRTPNGRFARSPLGRVLNRAIGRRPAGGASGGSPARPKSVGGRLRSMLPSWAGGTRSKRPGGSAGGSSAGGSRASRVRSMLSRLKPGGRRPGSSSGATTGGRPGRSGGSSQSGPKAKTGSRLGRAAAATRRAARTVGTKLGIRPKTPSPSGAGGSSRPKGKGGKKPAGGSGNSVTPDAVLSGADKAGRLLGRGLLALLEPLRGLRRRKKSDPVDDFDPNSTYEIGIEGEVVNGKHTDSELGEVAKRARKLAKKRRKDAPPPPVWPNVDVDEVPLPPVHGPDPWPDYDVDAYAPKSEQRQPKQSLPPKRDHDPPPSPPVSPPPHRENRREAPRITSANTGGNPVTQQTPKITQQAAPSGVSAANYTHHITTTPSGRATGWGEAADHARRDAVTFDEKADRKNQAAEEFERTGNQAAAAEARQDAAQFRQDASTCRTIAAGYQTEANKEASSAA